MKLFTAKFVVGLFLLFTNSLVGWGGIVMFTHKARITSKKIYLFFGIITYIFSWGMLIVGMILIGNEGILMFKRVAVTYKWEIRSVASVAILGFLLYVIRKNRKTKQIKTVSEIA